MEKMVQPFACLWRKKRSFICLLLLLSTCIVLHPAITMVTPSVAIATSDNHLKQTEGLRATNKVVQSLGGTSKLDFTEKENLVTRQNAKSILIGGEKIEIGNTLQSSAVRIENETQNRVGGIEGDADKRSDVIGGNSSDTHDRRILIGGDHCLEYSLTGTLFQEGKTILQENEIKTCHLKTIGKEIEDECHKHFIDLNNLVTIFVKSPSMQWFNGDLMVSFKFDVKPRTGTRNDCFGFLCGHLYTNKFDRYLNPIGQREIFSIQSPIHPKARDRSGVDDARMFQINNSLYNVLPVGYTSYKLSKPQTHLISGIFDYQQRKYFIPEFIKQMVEKRDLLFEKSSEGARQKLEKNLEKNWVPVVVKNEVFIIRHLDPLQILKCRFHESCNFIKTGSTPHKYIRENSPLRGGTGFELYQYPYYIGVAHGTYYNGRYKRYYSYLVILCVDPFRIVYVSDPVQIHPDLFQIFSGPRIFEGATGNFIFPTGLMVESEDSIVIGAHVNDRGSIFLRMEGIKDLMENVIKSDETKQYINPDFSIQNYFLHRERVQNLTGLSV